MTTATQVKVVGVPRGYYTRDELAYFLRISVNDVDRLHNLGIFKSHSLSSYKKFCPEKSKTAYERYCEEIF